MTDIEWESPPPKNKLTRTGVWEERLAPFRERPGEWGKLPGDYNAAVATDLRKGTYKGTDKGEFEVVSHNVPDSRRAWLWVRYVGNGEGKPDDE